MIWSEQELANMAIGGKDITIERVMKQLDNSENKDIFLKKNFSFLWGILGIAGVEGASESAKEKIWQSLKENGAVDAYDKGILADFTQRLAAKYKDSRLRAWQNLDNFEAGRFFNQVILKELFNTNEKLELETISYCYDEIKLISSLANNGISSRLKIYLESLRKQDAVDSSSGTVLTKVFEKEVVLRKLSDVIATSSRTLSEEEKNYLFYYLREAVASGFDAYRIGLDDQVLARLMADFGDKEVAEVEAQPMLTRNADIMEFVAKAEENSVFFEECAAKYIRNDKKQIPVMIERCLTFIRAQNHPRGVVFALELINLGQVKSAVMILEELAKKGAATEMVCFLHRLLPQAKGAEKLLLGILQMNLRNQPTRNPWGESSFFFEYISRRYLQAARAFGELGLYKESAGLLQEIVLGKWFEAQDDLDKELLGLTNWLLYQDKNLEKDLLPSIKKLNLQIFRENDAVFVGTEADNPITAARHRLEQKIKTTTTFDVGGVLDKMSKAESSTYGIFKNIKQAFSSNKNKEEAVLDQLPPIVMETIDEAFSHNQEDNIAVEVDSFSKKDEQSDVQIVSDKPKVKMNIETNEDGAKDVDKTDSKLALFKKKINLSNILPGNIHELGDDFNKIKKATSSAFKKFDKGYNQDNEMPVLPEDSSNDETSENIVSENIVAQSGEPVYDHLTDTKTDDAVTEDTVNNVVDEISDNITNDEIENSKENIIDGSLEVDDSVSQTNVRDNVSSSEEIKEDKSDDVMLASTANEVTNINNENKTVDTIDESKKDVIIDSTLNVVDDNETPVVDNDLSNKETEAVSLNEESTAIPQDDELSVENIEENVPVDVEPSGDTVENSSAEIENSKQDISPLEDNKPELSEPLVPGIQSWDDETNDNIEANDSKLSAFKNKVNISKILKIKPEDVDKHFDRIKKITSGAVKRAEEQMTRVRQRVEDADIANSQSVNKIKNIAKKIKLFKKK